MDPCIRNGARAATRWLALTCVLAACGAPGVTATDDATPDGDAATRVDDAPVGDSATPPDDSATPDGGAHGVTVTCGPRTATFYTVPPGIERAAPGTVLRCETTDEGATPLFAGYRSYRVAYASTSVVHEGGRAREVSVALSGQVFVPLARPTGPRPVLANTHGATGMIAQCAPSTRPGSNFDARVVFTALASAVPGAVVVVPDFLGLGLDGGARPPDAAYTLADPLVPGRAITPMGAISHSYVSLEGQGRATIDLVRAARAMPEAALGASPRWFVLGVSQGGHAALSAGEVWTRGYGADTALVGVMAGAPGSELADRTYVLDAVERILTPMVLAGLSIEHRDVRTSTLLTRHALGSFAHTAGERCLAVNDVGAWLGISSSYFLTGASLWVPGGDAVPAVLEALRANSPGHAPTSAPVMIGQVEGDPFIDPRRTARLVTIERATNPGRVTSCVYPADNVARPPTERGGNHAAFEWMFSARPATCNGPDGAPVPGPGAAAAFVSAAFARR